MPAVGRDGLVAMFVACGRGVKAGIQLHELGGDLEQVLHSQLLNCALAC